MAAPNSWQQQARIEPMSSADFELAWTLADFHQHPGFLHAMNGYPVKHLLASMLIDGSAVSAVRANSGLCELQRKTLLKYAKDLHSQLFPRVGFMFIGDNEIGARRIRMSPSQ